jgi:glycosyltransferase involved in cell wall biosynthesis
MIRVTAEAAFQLEAAGEDRDLAAAGAFVRANSQAYEWLVMTLRNARLRQAPAENVLDLVVSAARSAAVFHPGRFADGAIENPALEIGAGLAETGCDDETVPLADWGKESRRRILHVASDVGAIGGHSRMLYHWVLNDRSSRHSLALVDQRDRAIPAWMTAAVRASGGTLVASPAGSSLLTRARWLRILAKRTADLVVLHHGASDVVPTVAFARRDCPPVVVLNHADHTFWLGSSVADLVINLRTAGAAHTAQWRFVPRNVVLPVPLETTAQRIPRQDARRALGIPDCQIALLSIGRPEKYTPCGPYDFVRTAGRILDCHPRAHMYVVGESAEGIGPHLRCRLHERLHFLGSIEDPSVYRAAADVYVESFPFGSQTALLEAALDGLPVVPAYAPLFPLLVTNDDALLDVMPNPSSEKDYVERASRLIGDSALRDELGQMLRKRLMPDHVGDGWLDRLAGVYGETDCLVHSPASIPETGCSTTDADVSLSRWHVAADGRTYSRSGSTEDAGALLCHSAFVMKYVGNYTAARRLAWRAVRHDPARGPSWRLLAIALAGRTGGRLRAALQHN